MSLMQKLEQAVEAVEDDVKTEASDAVAELKRLAQQAEKAESDIVTYVVNHRAEIIALAKQYEPEVVQALEAIAEKLLANVKGSFEIG